MMSLQIEQDRIAHLLRRFGLGASEAELEYYGEGGYKAAVEKLLNYDGIDEGAVLSIEALRNDKQVVNLPGVIAWWTVRLLTTRRPLQEKMTLFWHDHFATSASKVVAPMTMYRQNEVLRENATGKFRDLLGAISKDPAMLFWLDNQENVRGKPNENFAREVMELFTLGVGHYTEKDVSESARAFTGWSIQRLTRDQALLKRRQAEFAFRPPRHDSGEKTILGKTGNLTGDDVLDMLCEHPRTAEYLTAKIWTWFVAPEPSPAVVSKYAKVFRESGLEIKVLLRAIMLSDEFSAPASVRSVVKNPADFCVVTFRQLGVGGVIESAVLQVDEEGTVPRRAIAPAFVAQLAMKNMGMWLLYPPDVDGWEGGHAWITSATMVERMRWAEKALARAVTANLFEDLSPRGVVLKLVSVMDAPIKKEKIPALVAAAEKASGGTVTARNVSATAIAVGRLIFASPEFQFA